MKLFGITVPFTSATIKAAEAAIVTEGQKLANLILANPVIRSEVERTITFLESQALKGIAKLDWAASAAIPVIADHIPVLGVVSQSVAILVVQTVYNDVTSGVMAEVRKLLAKLGL